jgi:hypothetical protein
LSVLPVVLKSRSSRLSGRRSVGHLKVRNEDARRTLVFRIVRRRFRKRLREIREVELPARPDHGPDIGLPYRDLLEARARAPQARQLEVDDQRLEARERLAVRVREAQAVDFELERERIEAHFADGE